MSEITGQFKSRRCKSTKIAERKVGQKEVLGIRRRSYVPQWQEQKSVSAPKHLVWKRKRNL